MKNEIGIQNMRARNEIGIQNVKARNPKSQKTLQPESKTTRKWEKYIVKDPEIQKLIIKFLNDFYSQGI